MLEQGSAERERMRAVRTKMTIPPVMDDLAAMLAFIDRQDAVERGPLYGTWLLRDAEESPHLNLGKVRRARTARAVPRPSAAAPGRRSRSSSRIPGASISSPVAERHWGSA